MVDAFCEAVAFWFGGRCAEDPEQVVCWCMGLQDRLRVGAWLVGQAANLRFVEKFTACELFLGIKRWQDDLRTVKSDFSRLRSSRMPRFVAGAVCPVCLMGV